jgi:hypothetical protein
MKFEDLKLNYGYPLQLQTTNAVGQAERYSCRLIGCLPGRSILLSVPKVGGKLMKFRSSQKLVVRLMVDNGIGIFASVVETQTQDPYAILHISYPENVSFKGIRSATRVVQNLPVEITNVTRSDRPSLAGVMADISISGTRIELANDIADIGESLELRMLAEIRDVKREMILVGIVRSRVEPTENQNEDVSICYGVEFGQQTEEQRLLMYAYVFNQMALQDHFS